MKKPYKTLILYGLTYGRRLLTYPFCGEEGIRTPGTLRYA